MPYRIDNNEWVPIGEETPDVSGLVPETRKVNGHALDADVTVTKTDVGLGNVENALQVSASGSAKTLWAGTQAAYDAISSKDASTVYVVVDS